MNHIRVQFRCGHGHPRWLQPLLQLLKPRVQVFLKKSEVQREVSKSAGGDAECLGLRGYKSWYPITGHKVLVLEKLLQGDFSPAILRMPWGQKETVLGLFRGQ